jgi:DNA-binding beta-propeller fold protein YncE
MKNSKINPDVTHHNDYYGFILRAMVANTLAVMGCPYFRGMRSGLFPALVLVVLAGCSSGGGSTSSSTQVPVTAPTGSILLTGRTKPVSTNLISGAASPDSVTLTIEEAAISTDGNNYETIVQGPIDQKIDAQMPPIIGEKSGLSTGSYKSLKLSVSKMTWNANWTFSNPSPCDGAATGAASGSQDQSARPILYFKTADLGGNTQIYYQNTPPLSGYAGDGDHPFLLAAPIQVLQDETTTVNLVLGADYSLGCSHLSAFSFTASDPAPGNPDVAPLREIVGSATQLFGSSGLTVDANRNQLVVTNGVTSSLAAYSLSDANNAIPLRSLLGSDTKLNDPAAVALYLGQDSNTKQPDPNGDQYIVLNRNNDSIVTFAWNDSGNAAPLRTIWGGYTGLSKPSDIALNLDPFGDGDPAKDEILVANSGNNSITSYTRLGDADSFPLVVLQGSLTELNGACGIGIDRQDHEVFVTNKNSDTITVYDLYDLDASRNIIDPNTGTVLTSPHINIPPLLTINSPSGLASPCGIAVGSSNTELIVANSANNSISVFDLAALQSDIQDPITNAVTVNVKRSIAGLNTGLIEPTSLQLSGDKLWVSHDGGQVVMAQTPQITPAVSNENAMANSGLNGDYNIVQFGIDLRKGVNGYGSKIPVLHAERGTVSFNAHAPNWPSFTFQRDSGVRQFMRQVIEPGCNQPDLNVKNGFFGVAADNSFYAFTQDNQGIFNGSFLPDGAGFTGVSYDGDQMYVIYGIKSTGVAVPYFSGDGTEVGSPVNYGYVSYSNDFQNILRFGAPAKSDQFVYLLDAGYLYTNPSQFLTLFTSSSLLMTFDPMGDYQPPSSNPPRPGSTSITGTPQRSPTTLHAGGFFENPGFGMAGALSNDGQFFVFMNNITDVDANDCQTTGGIGIGLRQRDPGTFKTKDIKGTYFISGIGDDYTSRIERGRYFSMSGSITFDGGGSATMIQNKDSEGEVTSSNNTYAYQVVSVSTPGVHTIGLGPKNTTMDILYLYTSDNATTPYASAKIGMDGKLLAFYRMGDTRLLGYAMLQKP